jgi:hypothetical protein
VKELADRRAALARGSSRSILHAIAVSHSRLWTVDSGLPPIDLGSICTRPRLKLFFWLA